MFVSGAVVAVGALSLALLSSVVAARDPIATPPPPRTIEQSFCSNNYFTCRDIACADAIGGEVRLPGYGAAVRAGSGKFSSTPTKMYTCEPSSLWKHTCTERPVQCGEYAFFTSSGCAGAPIFTRPGYQISCR